MTASTLDPNLLTPSASTGAATSIPDFYNDLIAAINNHASGINNFATGSLPRTDVRSIGVVMNDSTKRAANTAAWKTYIAAQQTAGSPISIWIPSGTMYVGRDGTGFACLIFLGITVGIDIAGQGEHSTTVDWGGTGNGSGWSCFRFASGTTNFSLSDMTITQSTITSPDAGQQHHCIFSVATTGADVTNGSIRNVITNPAIGSGFYTLGGNDGVNDFMVRNVWASNYRCYGGGTARSGIELQRGYTDIRMSNFYIEHCKDGEVNLEPTATAEMSHAVLENGLVVHDPAALGFSAVAWNGNSASTTYNSRSRLSNIRVIDGQVQLLTTEFVDVDNLSIELTNANAASAGLPALQLYQNNKDVMLRNVRIKRTAASGDGDLIQVTGETGSPAYLPARLTIEGGDLIQQSAGNIINIESCDALVIRDIRLQMQAASPSTLDFIKIKSVLSSIDNVRISGIHCTGTAKARAVIEISASGANFSITDISITDILAGQSTLATTGIIFDIPSSNGASIDAYPVMQAVNFSGCDTAWGASNHAVGIVFPVVAGNRGGVCTMVGTVAPGGTVTGAYGSQYIYINGASSALYINLSGSTTWTQITIP